MRMTKEKFLKEWEKTIGLPDPERTRIRLKLLEVHDETK